MRKYLKLNQLWFIIGVVFSCVHIAYADTAPKCYINASKAKGWKNYDVVIKVYNYNDNKLITTIDLAKPQNNHPSIDSLQVPLDCAKNQQLSFTATFTPTIWANQKNAVYSGKKFLDISAQVMALPPKEKLEININFPKDFDGVPSLLY